jgi:hypothetical protein
MQCTTSLASSTFLNRSRTRDGPLSSVLTVLLEPPPNNLDALQDLDALQSHSQQQFGLGVQVRTAAVSSVEQGGIGSVEQVVAWAQQQPQLESSQAPA